MLSLLFVLMLQIPPQQVCEDAGGYFKDAGQICLTQENMNSNQLLLVQSLRRIELELDVELSTQRRFNAAGVLTSLDSRILELEIKRDMSSDRGARTFQEEIVRLTRIRDRVQPIQPDSLRDKAIKLGTIIAQLTRDISDLKQDLDASILKETP